MPNLSATPGKYHTLEIVNSILKRWVGLTYGLDGKFCNGKLAGIIQAHLSVGGATHISCRLYNIKSFMAVIQATVSYTLLKLGKLGGG